MSENMGVATEETLHSTTGDESSLSTDKEKGASQSQTITPEEFQKLQSLVDSFKGELSSRDKKIAELQKKESISLKSLQEDLIKERNARERSEFALKNGVTDDFLPYLQGQTKDELSQSWQNLSSLIERKVEEKILKERAKLDSKNSPSSHTLSQSPSDEETLIKAILGS